MLVTGGSDYHGAVKPGVKLAAAMDGNLKIPDDVLYRLKNRSA